MHVQEVAQIALAAKEHTSCHIKQVMRFVVCPQEGSKYNKLTLSAGGRKLNHTKFSSLFRKSCKTFAVLRICITLALLLVVQCTVNFIVLVSPFGYSKRFILSLNQVGCFGADEMVSCAVQQCKTQNLQREAEVSVYWNRNGYRRNP